ncbi:MAG: hypothetical protein Q8Q17_02410 [bacterium]|nr:hypothetical protein [bacterium]
MENYKPKLKIILTFAFLTFILLSKRGEDTSGSLDSFAQCLASKGITMYGAEWCSHCQNEKNRFGDSFRFVPYVECPADPNRCLSAGVNAYPTWIFPASLADGPGDKKLVGEQGLQKLSDESGCPLPAQK